ncbi:hypothetical protein SAMN04487950_1413 [Halogranum rubrum]|uniref:Uncharacterized protein n=1 Tax=Halogranum rubrum TaxID=553466 RepID=A0A1I4CUA0_9EURY|nr:hypothetical protein [Halogranum rubrum]SFK84832.1 hypothetical protein SAMN04487950_1413 [Halogranum rubrum]
MNRLARTEKWLFTLSPRTVRVFGLALRFTGLGIGTLTSFGIGSAGIPLSLSLVLWGAFGTLAWFED